MTQTGCNSYCTCRPSLEAKEIVGEQDSDESENYCTDSPKQQFAQECATFEYSKAPIKRFIPSGIDHADDLRIFPGQALQVIGATGCLSQLLLGVVKHGGPGIEFCSERIEEKCCFLQCLGSPLRPVGKCW